ncbi:MAG: hypothetical protein K2Y39_12585 [Candidatus Obscuribacterales bacterium]|nr:hypothetical protein [Candidatus Obscuribacterales bacterium]
MPVDKLPNFKPPVEKLFQLTKRELTLEEFKAACEKFAKFDPANSDADLWNFCFGDDVDTQLSVSLKMKQAENSGSSLCYKPFAVECASLPFCWWESFSRKHHQSDESFSNERAEFDEAFNEELARAEGTLGAPLFKGAPEIEPFLKFAVWKDEAGFLLLSQSDNDPQFGYDINYTFKPVDFKHHSDSEHNEEWLRRQIYGQPQAALPKYWKRCEPGLEQELSREITFNFFHPLRFVQAISVARHTSTDDVLFELVGHKHKYAQVHLTWARETHRGWPDTCFFESWDEWAIEAERESSEG